MNALLNKAPFYGPLGPPFYMLLAEPMNTDGGFTALIADKLNAQFKRIFDVWAAFLISPASTHVLTTEPGGWFHSDAITAMEADYDGLTFAQIFDCDPDKPHWGYTSWDKFFVRAYNPRTNPRPVEGPDSPNVINAACESAFYNMQTNAEETDQFWIKGEPYSLRHMLNNDEEYAEKFYGGTVIQGFLQVTGYHRWHSPVDGEIKKVVTVSGTYFVQSPALLNSPVDNTHNPYLHSLAFITSLTTRMLIFIESDNPAIGLMCFVAIGMTEVSTCEATVQQGQQVKRGDELGMFHFGGSSHCMVFRPGVKINWDGSVIEPAALIRVRSAIGVVESQ
jgi:phosphatidylserine decarboxylase